jgi:chromosome segregation ATPase
MPRFGNRSESLSSDHALITASEAAREDLGSELKRLRDRVGDLRAVQEKLAATREELKRTTTAREDAASQLVGFQREVAAISSRLEKTKDRVVVTGGIKKAEPSRRPR